MKQNQEMALAKRETRYDLKPAVKARLYLAPQNTTVTVNIVNLSKSGLSVRCGDAIPAESDVYLILHGQQVRLVEIWELPAPNGKVAYGFKCARRDTDLVKLFVGAGVSIAKAKEKTQSEEEHFVEEFSTMEFEAFPAA